MTEETPKLLALPPKRKHAHHKAHAHAQVILNRQHKAFDLRLQGKTYTTIAKELGVSIGTVHSDLETVAKMKYKGLIEKDQNLLLEQNAFYDSLLERWLPLALSEDLNVGEKRKNRRGEEYDVNLSDWEASATATDKCLKILEGKAKANGLAAPNTLAKTTEELGTSVALSVLEAFRRLSQTPKKAEIIEDKPVEFEPENGN